MPSMMMFGNKTFERYWSYENGTLMNNIGVPPRYPKDCFAHPPFFVANIWTQSIMKKGIYST